MAYYVPLGSRGVLLRIGTALIGLLGSVAYGCGHRRRRRASLPAKTATTRVPTRV